MKAQNKTKEKNLKKANYQNRRKNKIDNSKVSNIIYLFWCRNSMKLVMKWSATSQGKLLRVCLETTVRYDSISKKNKGP